MFNHPLLSKFCPGRVATLGSFWFLVYFFLSQEVPQTTRLLRPHKHPLLSRTGHLHSVRSEHDGLVPPLETPEDVLREDLLRHVGVDGREGVVQQEDRALVGSVEGSGISIINVT